MRALARLAGELGDGRVELTSRGNVQLRGLAADAAGPLTDQLTRAGLFPSPRHDLVRNVLASPLAGLDGGPDLTAIVQTLDAALCARPRLAELPGRFLFAVDDGRGDVVGLGPDVVAQVRADGAVVNGLAVRSAATGHAGTDYAATGHAVAEDVVTVMLACAEAFLDATDGRGRHGVADRGPGRRADAGPGRGRRAPRAGHRCAADCRFACTRRVRRDRQGRRDRRDRWWDGQGRRNRCAGRADRPAGRRRRARRHRGRAARSARAPYRRPADLARRPGRRAPGADHSVAQRGAAGPARRGRGPR